jgi:hypothetical protein
VTICICIYYGKLGIAKELVNCTHAKIVLSARRKEELERVKRECLGMNLLNLIRLKSTKSYYHCSVVLMLILKA